MLHEIRFELTTDVKAFIDKQPAGFHTHYADIKAGFKESVCAYINAEPRCLHSGFGFFPLSSPIENAKLIKARVSAPGRGKSGSLRIEFLAFCKEKRIKLVQIDERKDL